MNNANLKKIEMINKLKARINNIKNDKPENIETNKLSNNLNKIEKENNKKILDILSLNNIFSFKSSNLEELGSGEVNEKYVQTTNEKAKYTHKQSVMSRMVRNTIKIDHTKLNINNNNINNSTSQSGTINEIKEENEESKNYVYTSKENFKSLENSNNFKDFENFINKSSKYVEKLFLSNIGNDNPNSSEECFIYNKKNSHMDNLYSNNLNWSNLFDNLYLTVYSYYDHNQKINKDTKSFCYIWNTEYNYPEFKLKSDIEISKAVFDNKKGDIIIGGLDNGNIILYDTRASIYPVLKSKSYIDNENINIVGLDILENNNVVTANEDGRIINWDMKNLKEPVKNNLYSYYHSKKSDKLLIYSLCMSINHKLNNIYLGCFDNSIKEISKKSDEENLVEKNFNGHNGPITSICHSNYIKSNFLNSIMISSSMDWEINFWNEEIEKPIFNLSFHNDYVTSLDWNPYNPGIIASADTLGNYYIWNFLKNKNYPAMKFNTKTNEGVKKIKFNNKGDLVAISDFNGNIEIQKISEEELNFSEKEVKSFEKFLEFNFNETKNSLIENINDEDDYPY